LFEELGLKQDYPLKVYEDNTATIAMSKNPIINKKSKHIELAVHFFKSWVQRKQIQLFYIASLNQQADILTKIVASMSLFYSLIKKLFNLSTITIPESSEIPIEDQEDTEQIGQVNMINNFNPDVQTIAQRIHRAYEHAANNNWGYLGSNAFEQYELIFNDERIFFIQLWDSDEVFFINDIKLLAFIIERYLVRLTHRYSTDLMEKITQDNGVINVSVNNNEINTVTRVEGIVHIQRFHSHIESLIKKCNIMRRVILYFHHNNIDTLQINRSESTEIVNLHIDDILNYVNQENNGFAGMIRALTPEEELIQLWLENDQLYQSESIRISNIQSLNPRERSMILDSARQESLVRRQLHLDELLQQQQHQSEEFLNIDSAYQADLIRISQYTISDSDREALFNAAKKTATSKHNKKSKTAQDLQSTTDALNDCFKSRGSIDPNLQAFNDFINKPIQETQIGKPKQKLHHLHRNNEEPVTKISSTEPEPLTHHHHRRMTRFLLTTFYNLVYRLHNEVYTAVMNYMALTESLLERRNQDNDEDDFEDTESESKHKRHKKKSRQQQREEEEDETSYLALENSKLREEENENDNNTQTCQKKDNKKKKKLPETKQHDTRNTKKDNEDPEEKGNEEETSK
jgi:hypothetical protein